MNIKDILTSFHELWKLQKMNYYSDPQGIMNRYLREKDNWDHHIVETKNFILKSAETKKKGKVVVLGSGWLLDLPLKELSEIFKEVVLVDIVHPKKVLKKIKAYPNVIAANADITGGMINYFYENLSKKNIILFPAERSFEFNLPENTDFVISLNICCQLHIILIDYIKKFNLYTAKNLLELEKNIQYSHIKMLPKNKSCLITDIEEEILDSENQSIGINPLIHIDLPDGNFSKSWQWKFDLQMRYRDDAKTYFNTQAIDI